MDTCRSKAAATLSSPRSTALQRGTSEIFFLVFLCVLSVCEVIKEKMLSYLLLGLHPTFLPTGRQSAYGAPVRIRRRIISASSFLCCTSAPTILVTVRLSFACEGSEVVSQRS